MKIAAVFGNVGSDSPKAYVERMCKAQLACDWHTHSVFEVPGGAIGIVRASEKFGESVNKYTLFSVFVVWCGD
jgi:hypothetical protein